MSVTRDDVAKLAGVSPATVSYVVNNGPRPVSPETRQRVLWAIEQLNYTPSAIARSLKTSQTHTIGLIISDILNPFLASIVKSTEDLLLARDYGLIVVNSDESPERELFWLRMLLRRRMDGLNYSIADPSITAVAVDPAEMAGKAIEFVIERITQTFTGEPRTTLVSCCLRVRESTGGQGVLEEP